MKNEEVRRPRGNLPHLAALAMHLENTGKLAEAAEFRRKYDALAAQLAAKEKTVGP